jgi:Putative translation initiation inhibitor, yjgF family
MSVQRLHVSQRFSEIAIAGNLVHLAGQLATDLDLDIKGQTQQTLDISTSSWRMPVPIKARSCR